MGFSQAFIIAALAAAPPAQGLVLDWSWIAGGLIVQIIVGLTAGVIGAWAGIKVLGSKVQALEKAVYDQARTMADLQSALAELGTTSAIHDKRIEADMARSFVPRGECGEFRREIRDTHTRLFSRFEAMQAEQGRQAGKLDTILDVVKRGTHGQP